MPARRAPASSRSALNLLIAALVSETPNPSPTLVVSIDRQIGPSRFRACLYQLAAEVHASVGQYESVHQALDRSTEQGLVDVAWLDRCPLFEPMRSDPEFARVRTRVAARAAEAWEPAASAIKS